jgi:hypothetical protein
MIPPTPGADASSRLFGYATPPDGAGPIGPDQLWPTAIHPSHDEAMQCLNPLQYLPGVGMIYRAATGTTLPMPCRVLGGALSGGPVGMLLAGFGGMLEGLLSMKPDLSRPSVPAGMAATGSEAPMTPISPGTLDAGAYTTLATITPEWLQSPTQDTPTQYANSPARGQMAYQQASLEWQRSQALEKGLA